MWVLTEMIDLGDQYRGDDGEVVEFGTREEADALLATLPPREPRWMVSWHGKDVPE